MDALAATTRSRRAAPRRLLRLRSDAYLAERFADGDEAAFSTLFERHRASVLAVCIGVLGSRHDAEDAAQETFASLAVALRSSPPRELRAWLARVARNSSIDLARRRRTRESACGKLSNVGGDGGVSSSQLVKDELESVVAGIRELPETQRTALLMRELAGHSYREIADLLKTDEDAVRGLIARARIGLRRYREAAELPCAAARAAIAAEPDGRRHDRTVRRHLRSCASCRAYRTALRDDARALRGLVPLQAGGAAGGSAVVGLAAKGALLGTAATQVTAACAVSVCAVGGIALLTPALATHHPVRAAAAHRAGARQPPLNGHRAHSLMTSSSSFERAWHSSSVLSTRRRGASTAAAITATHVASFRAVASGSSSQASVSTRGTYSVPAGGRPRGSSQASGGQGQGSSGNPAQTSAPASGRPGNAGYPGEGSSSSSGSGTDSTPVGAQQNPAAPTGSAAPPPGSGSGTGGSPAGPGFAGPGRFSAGDLSDAGERSWTGRDTDAGAPGSGPLGSGPQGSSATGG
ncbi:MAG TPA: RNA polymerase sigma factor [Solirubrobacteraceae bacterium]|nr:RNA polymerase sigma factor [Solirubrobacteraceae bacterium]